VYLFPQRITHYKVVLRDAKSAGLSEICYRFNRRFWEKELFDRLVLACISTETITYKELIGPDEDYELSQ
jgi:hypothetical protein